jgi:hypothetical protein
MSMKEMLQGIILMLLCITDIFSISVRVTISMTKMFQQYMFVYVTMCLWQKYFSNIYLRYCDYHIVVSVISICSKLSIIEMCQWYSFTQEEFEDIRIRISKKNRQYNVQKKKYITCLSQAYFSDIGISYSNSVYLIDVSVISVNVTLDSFYIRDVSVISVNVIVYQRCFRNIG